MKTIVAKQLETKQRKWYVIDANGLNLWRLSAKIAQLLRGKNKVDFTRHVENGDYVIVLNCDKFAVTGKKLSDKLYHTHSRHLGWIKEFTLKDMLVRAPEKALELWVYGMLPKTKHRHTMLSRLKLITGTEHTFVSQKPETITL
jgi:large subunit ribosomal protein L13